MKARVTRFIEDPDTSTVLFFQRNNKLFPVVVAENLPLFVAEAAEKSGRLINATFTGFSISPSQWNEIVQHGDDPCKIYEDIIAANVIVENLFAADRPTG